MKQTFDASLKDLNSFSVEAYAGRLLELESADDLQSLITDFHFDAARDLILGGGSNILFAENVEGTVVLNRVMGRQITPASDGTFILEACAGENWHELVLWSLEQGLSGIENLSLIPGLAGAAPMQNIGAYGVELSDVLNSVQAFDLQSGTIHEFRREECGLAYRDSRFKSADAGRYLVIKIRLRLQRNFSPQLNYAGLGEELAAMGVDKPTAKQVSEAVIRIRRRKLPDPAVTGNAGSFFRNPLVSQATAKLLGAEFEGLPVYLQDEESAKLSAAWLIEHCGWEGRCMGPAAVSSQHALVLVNNGNATGAEILALAYAIRKSVRDRFGIELQAEPRIVEAKQS